MFCNQRGKAVREEAFGEGAEDDTRGRVSSPMQIRAPIFTEIQLAQLIGSFEDKH
jgi:hypothetical protein